MKYNELEATQTRKKNRVGRGIAAGQGKTAGRGTKGQKARKSGGVRPGFEGGQTPLMMRLPKLRGFTSHREKTHTLYTGQLDNLAAAVDNYTLAEAGIIPNAYVRVKLVLKGSVLKKHTVKLQVCSDGALKTLQKTGGSFVKVEKPKRTSTSDKNNQK